MHPNTFFNPLEEINFLIENVSITDQNYTISIRQYQKATSISPVTNIPDKESEMIQLMEGITLDQKMQDQRIQKGSRKPSFKVQSVKIIQSPRHINDYYKLAWMIGQNIHPSVLMTKIFPKQDNYLKSLHNIMTNELNFPAQFVEIYPHTHNLKATRRIEQGTTVLQINSQWFINSSIFDQSIIIRYIRALFSMIVRGQKVFNVPIFNICEKYIHEIKQVQDCTIPIYIFQKKFVQQILKTSFAKDKAEAFQWLYFQLLPEDFNYHPLKQWETIKPYHKYIGVCLQAMQFQLIEEYKRIKQLIDGDYLKEEFSFKTFLQAQNSAAGLSIFQKYHRQFTPKNYVWSRLCEKTRSFNLQTHGHNFKYDMSQGSQFSFLQSKSLVPILDLFHHSSSNSNLDWQYNKQKQSITIKAKRSINCGDLLYINYADLSLQSLYVKYGFAESSESLEADLQIILDFSLVYWLAAEVFNRKITPQFQQFLEIYSERDDISIQIRVQDSELNTYEDQLNFKEAIIADTLDSYKQFTLRMVNRYNLMAKKVPVIKQVQIKNKKLRRKIISLIIHSFYKNIQIREKKIQRIEIFCRQLSIQSSGFNHIYQYKCIITILASEINLLRKVVRFFQQNER